MITVTVQPSALSTGHTELPERMSVGWVVSSMIEPSARSFSQTVLVRVSPAVPVAPADSLQRVSLLADEVLCPEVPHSFGSVGQWYEAFDQTSDDEVRDLLSRAAPKAAGTRDTLNA